MNLKDQINEDLNKALKQRDELSLSVLRMVKSALKNLEIEKKEETTEEDVLLILEKQAKQRRESIEQYEKAGRQDLEQKEEDELKILEDYLPEKLGEEDIKTKVSEIVEGLTTEEKSNFGKVMGASMTSLKGKADPSLVSKVVKDILGG